MENFRKKQFFLRHAKSSAMMVSLAIHVALILVAVSFVAVTVIQKEDQKFEAKPVKRPKMQLKKLQVPVNIKKKKTQKPKLRKRILVTPKLSQNMPDIKMPEISGIKGGMGSAGGSGLGGSGGIGFTLPEINIFGVKSKGEKVFIMLDSNPEMMVDEIGGITSYTLIKDELAKIIGGMAPTTLFNLAVFERRNCVMLFPKMQSASPASVAKAKGWLGSLNAVTQGMADNAYGVKTLGPGGTKTSRRIVEPLTLDHHWFRPSILAMDQQADTVFILTRNWPRSHRMVRTITKDISPEQKKKDAAKEREAVAMLAAENEERKKKGIPPRVIAGRRTGVYFPNYKRGKVEFKDTDRYDFVPKDVIAAMNQARKEASSVRLQTSLKKKKNKYSVNVIQFQPKGEVPSQNLKKMASLGKGKYSCLKGLDAIRFSASASASE